MQAFKLNQPVPELQPIGSVSLLGALPTEGDPQVAVAMIYGKPEDVFTCGLFSSTRGGFTMIYPFTEHATVLEGEVELTVAGQEPIRFSPGDSWFVEQGTCLLYTSPSPRDCRPLAISACGDGVTTLFTVIPLQDDTC